MKKSYATYQKKTINYIFDLYQSKLLTQNILILFVRNFLLAFEVKKCACSHCRTWSWLRWGCPAQPLESRWQRTGTRPRWWAGPLLWLLSRRGEPPSQGKKLRTWNGQGSTCYENRPFVSTVNSVYNDNLWDPKIVVVVDRWSLFISHWLIKV